MAQLEQRMNFEILKKIGKENTAKCYKVQGLIFFGYIGTCGAGRVIEIITKWDWEDQKVME